MKLIITEKPSVARDIAKVLKITQKRDGYFESDSFWISWAFGHLIRLADPPAYNPTFEKWSLEDLPIIPTEFITEIQPEDHIEKQYKIIETLLNHQKLTEVICATDAGREGELIFRLIYEKSQCSKPVKRLWISSQTDQAIKEGFEHLKPGDDYLSLFECARSRSEADWIIGINATRAYTGRFSRGHGVMSVGRVQTPVLKMIVDRYLANTQFVPQTYYEIQTLIHHEKGQFSALWIGGPDSDSKLFNADAAQALYEKLLATQNGKIKQLTQKTIQEKAPLLYDLTELQKDANKKYKFSADETLKLMQNLYEKHKILTYPRTSSRYLSEDIKPKIPGLLENLTALPEYAPFAKTLIQSPSYSRSRIFDDGKVTDHHAIIPTDKKPDLSQLNDAELKIYNLVILRFLAGLMPECHKDQTEILSEFNSEIFRSFGSIIKKAGWREVYGKDDLEDEDPNTPTLPNVTENDPITHQNLEKLEKKTKAPPLHTEASILAAMETAGRSIEDEELRQAMKNCGLGTPATRAQILERLIKVDYILREKNKLIPTQKGIQLINYIQDKALLSAELTGEWEQKLNQIVSKTYSREAYMTEIKAFAQEIVHNVKSSTIQAIGVVKNPLGACPLCGGAVGETKLAYSCSQWKATQCPFKIWKMIAGKEISESTAKTLLKSKKTKVLKGFKSKAGNSFEAALIIDTQGDIKFQFEDKPAESIGKCPKCQSDVIERKQAFGCSNWKSTGCNFVIWKEQNGKTISKADAIQQLSLSTASKQG
jgi:DNA topoisomerase-3